MFKLLLYMLVLNNITSLKGKCVLYFNLILQFNSLLASVETLIHEKNNIKCTNLQMHKHK